MVIVDDKEIKKTKGVNKNIVDKIRHKEYSDVLFGRGLMRHNMKRIQSELYQEFGSRWISIERNSIRTVRVINECYV